MKKLTAIFLCMLSLILLTACGQATAPAEKSAIPTQTTTQAPAVTPTNTKSTPPPTVFEVSHTPLLTLNQAEAYVAVVEAAMEEIYEFAGESGYVSIDLTEGTITSPEEIYPLLDDCFKNEGFTVLHLTREELIEEGYADEHGNMIDGVLLSFSDVRSEKNYLSTVVTLHGGMLYATITRYTVTNMFNEWTVGDVELIAVA